MGKKQKDVELHNRFEREIYIKERKNLSLVQRGKRRSKSIYTGVNKKGYIWLSKSLQTILIFFVRKKNGKKKIV